MASAPVAAQAPLSVHSLTTEYRSDPLDIDTPCPRFSGKIVSAKAVQKCLDRRGKTVTNRLQVYATDEITVTFDPDICIHSGVCVRGLPAVFDVSRKHWIRPELAAANEVASQVARCPSGALQYKLKTD